MTKCNYANVTEEQKEKVIETYNAWVQMDGIGAGQAVSIAATRAFGLTDRQWNGKAGTDAFASALAILVMSKQVIIRAVVNGKEQPF